MNGNFFLLAKVIPTRYNSDVRYEEEGLGSKGGDEVMKFANSILERLFGTKQGNDISGQGEELQTPGQMANGEQNKEDNEAEKFLAHVPENQLEIPEDHALNQLYQLRREQAGGLPYPELLLEGCEAMPPEELKRELKRLDAELTSIAVSRLEEAVPLQVLPEEPEIVEDENETDGEEAEVNEQEEQEEIPEPELDALPVVFVSSNKMQAWIMVFPPVGQGRDADEEMLMRALQEKGVIFGVKEERLRESLKRPERYFHLIQAAEGRDVVQGEDGYIIDYFSRIDKRQIEVDEHGRVDYASLNLVQSAAEGDVICEAVPPTKAVPGRTVLDQEIPGRDGKAATLPKGRNTEISEDGSKLLASASGRLEYSGRSFQIKSMLDIEGNVDYSTGNINFLGDVHIRGDVCSGFSVRSVGNITVDGVVEAGTVEAGGDLIVAKGIIGDKEAIVRSHHNIYTKYLDNGIVHVRENLYTDSILHSEVYCDGEVQVVSGRGTIVGGTVRAAVGINAKIVGNRSESTTNVMLGGQPCADFERELLLENIEDLEEEMEALERQPESPARTKRMNKVRLDLSVDKMKLGQFNKDMEKAEKKQEAQGKSRLKCGIAYPGTVLTIGNETLHLTQETSSCDGRLVNGEIKLL